MLNAIPTLHKKYVKGTEKDAIVQFLEVLVCRLTVAAVKSIIGNSCNKVYINTRVLKHIYDKRPAVEYDFFVSYLHSVIKYPDCVYKNKDGKRGSYCFVKKMRDEKYLCSIQAIQKEKTTPIVCEVVTFFKVDDDYLKTYELLWEWEGGAPPS